MNNKLFCIDQRTLLSYMNKIKSFREEKPIIPYINHIYFEGLTDEQSISCRVSNQENSVFFSLKGIKKIEKPFKLCVENTFSLALSPRECDIWFNIDGEHCTISSPNGKVIVPTLDPEDFPISYFPKEQLFEIKEGTLFDILHTISPFTHPESTFSNNSLHFIYADETLRVGATDKKTSCSTAIHVPCAEKMNFMISRKSVTMLLDMLDKDSSSSCNVSRSHHDIVFTTPTGTFSCRQMAYDDMYLGNDYYRLSMPYASREGDIIRFEDKGLLTEQLHKTMIYSTRFNQSIQIKLERNLLTMEIEDPIIGRKSIQQLNVLFKHQGKATSIIINAYYFLRVIKSIKSETFEMNIPMDNGPGLDHVAEALTIQDNDFIYLIAPFTK